MKNRIAKRQLRNEMHMKNKRRRAHDTIMRVSSKASLSTPGWSLVPGATKYSRKGAMLTRLLTPDTSHPLVGHGALPRSSTPIKGRLSRWLDGRRNHDTQHVEISSASGWNMKRTSEVMITKTCKRDQAAHNVIVHTNMHRPQPSRPLAEVAPPG